MGFKQSYIFLQSVGVREDESVGGSKRGNEYDDVAV